MAIRITYNSTNIDLLIGPGGLRHSLSVFGKENIAGSGKSEHIIQYSQIFGVFDARFSQSVYETLIAWWAWAEQGKQWSFAMDSADIANTTLDAAAAAAQKVIPVTATTAITAGDRMLIRTAAGREYEIIEVDSVSAGVSVTAVSNLVYTYASADILRHWNYFPAVTLAKMGGKFDPIKKGPIYSHVFNFKEAL